MFIELAFSNWREVERRYEFTKDVNKVQINQLTYDKIKKIQ